MRQTLSIVLIVIAAVLVVGVKVVAPKPGSPRSAFHRRQDSGAQRHEEFSERAPATVTSAIGTKRTSLVAPHMSAFRV